MDANDRIYKLITKETDVTWQTILYELVKKEEMDPWDINVSNLAQQFIQTIKDMKEMDLNLSGKIVLCAAVLLKIKSKRLVNEELAELDNLLAEPEEEDLIDDLQIESARFMGDDALPPLIPRTPQPRKRKVSIFDLVDALEKALEVKERRVMNTKPPEHIIKPKKTRDITVVIREVYANIRSFFSKKTGQQLFFKNLLPSQDRDDKVFTFIPLLHLANQRKVDISQTEHFGPIQILEPGTLKDDWEDAEKESEDQS